MFDKARRAARSRRRHHISVFEILRSQFAGDVLLTELGEAVVRMATLIVFEKKLALDEDAASVGDPTAGVSCISCDVATPELELFGRAEERQDRVVRRSHPLDSPMHALKSGLSLHNVFPLRQ